jgi:hypothetical protein
MLIRLGAFLLLGAIATLAVAWCSAVWCDREVSPAALDDDDWAYRELTVSERAALDASGWQPRPAMMITGGRVSSMQPGVDGADEPPPPATRTRTLPGFERRLITENDVPGADRLDLPPRLFGRSIVAVRVRSGWPVLCISGEHWPDQSNAGAAARTIRARLISLGGTITPGDPDTRLIPLAVELPGFLNQHAVVRSSAWPHLAGPAQTCPPRAGGAAAVSGLPVSHRRLTALQRVRRTSARCPPRLGRIDSRLAPAGRNEHPPVSDHECRPGVRVRALVTHRECRCLAHGSAARALVGQPGCLAHAGPLPHGPGVRALPA